MHMCMLLYTPINLASINAYQPVSIFRNPADRLRIASGLYYQMPSHEAPIEPRLNGAESALSPTGLGRNPFSPGNPDAGEMPPALGRRAQSGAGARISAYSSGSCCVVCCPGCNVNRARMLKFLAERNKINRPESNLPSGVAVFRSGV